MNAEGVIETGLHSGEVDNLLRLSLEFDTDPYAVVLPRIDFNVLMTLHYAKRDVDLSDEDVSLEFYVDETQIPVKVTNGVDVPNSFPLQLSATPFHNFTWIFSQGLTTETAKVALSRMRVFGVKHGGATEQMPCPSGHFIGSNAMGQSGICQACPAGTYSVGTGKTMCSACPAGFVSQRGASICQKCPAGMMAKQATQCVPLCFFTGQRGVYNLTSLQGMTYAFVPNSELTIFLFSFNFS